MLAYTELTSMSVNRLPTYIESNVQPFKILSNNIVT